jgi:hypothetical protein
VSPILRPSSVNRAHKRLLVRHKSHVNPNATFGHSSASANDGGQWSKSKTHTREDGEVSRRRSS